MKKLLTALLATTFAWAPGTADAANEELAGKLVDVLHTQESLNPSARAQDPEKRDAYYRKVAVDFYADQFDETQLTDLLGFFQAPAGNRLIRTRGKVEQEVIVVVLSYAMGTDGVALPEAPSAAGESRIGLASKLMKSPEFETRIRKVALQYDVVRSKFESRPKKAEPASIELVRNLYVDRYSKRFGERLLKNLVTFYSTKLGEKFSKAQVELPKQLEKSAEKFSG